MNILLGDNEVLEIIANHFNVKIENVVIDEENRIEINLEDWQTIDIILKKTRNISDK